MSLLLKEDESDAMFGKLILEELRLIRHEMKVEVQKLRNDLICAFSCNTSLQPENYDADNHVAAFSGGPVGVTEPFENDLTLQNDSDSDSEYLMYKDEMRHDAKSEEVSASEDSVINVSSQMKPSAINSSNNIILKDVESKIKEKNCIPTLREKLSPKAPSHTSHLFIPNHERYNGLPGSFSYPIDYNIKPCLSGANTIAKYDNDLEPKENSCVSTISPVKTSATTEKSQEYRLQIKNPRKSSESFKLKVIKQMTCQVCSKTFASNIDYIRHIRTHTGEKPFQCKLCSKLFGRSFSLKRHMKNVHVSKNYSCEYCNKAFYTIKALKVHLTIHHNIKKLK